ncbi:hypothetical protein HRG_013164 [Hirsutella rhossiliensis]
MAKPTNEGSSSVTRKHVKPWKISFSTSVLIKSAYAKYWLYHKPASRTSNMCLHGEQWWKKPILCRNPQRTT